VATLAAQLATRAQERQHAERGRSGPRRDTAWKGQPAGPLSGLPSPRLTFTGRFRAGKAPEVLVAALALLAAPPAYPRLRLAANQQITFHHPNISFRGPQALKVRTGRG
jgi:hypothetical protein